MRKFTLLTSVLLTAPFAVGNVSAQCVATQDCASLGYTENSCENGGIKCPFGNAWACKGNADTGTEDSENGRDNPDCTYGAIYYSDGTCVKDFISEKTAIGVVVYDENNQKWVMALNVISPTTEWSTEYFDVKGITNYVSEKDVIHDMNSCENTDAMLARGEELYPAASAARNYAPYGAENTKGKWCLPSAGIWNMIINNHRTEIDSALSRANGSDLSSVEKYWSSSELSSKEVWICRPFDGLLVTTLKSNYGSFSFYNTTRPVMKI